jgi:hypothetical protein
MDLQKKKRGRRKKLDLFLFFMNNKSKKSKKLLQNLISVLERESVNRKEGKKIQILNIF